MEYTFEEYLKDVKSQLCCNNKEDVDYITYNYTEEQISRNIKHFESCLKHGLSAYKALLFFDDYVDKDIVIYHEMI